MFSVTLIDGKTVRVMRDDVRHVRALGDGALLTLKSGEPLVVMQSAERVLAMWKR